MGNKSSKEERSYWRPDAECKACEMCEASFTFLRRRHHCRSCGGLFCDVCSAQRICVPTRGHVTPVRVCNLCKMKGNDTRSSQSPPRRRQSDISYRSKRGSSNGLLPAQSNFASTSAPNSGGLGAGRFDDTTSNTSGLTNSSGLTRGTASRYRMDRDRLKSGSIQLPEVRRFAIMAAGFVLQHRMRRLKKKLSQREDTVFTNTILQSVAGYLSPAFVFDTSGAVSTSASVSSYVLFSNLNCGAFIKIPKKIRRVSSQQGMQTAGNQYGDDDDDDGVSSMTFMQQARHVCVAFTPMISTNAHCTVSACIRLPIASEREFGDIFDVHVGAIPETEWNEIVLSETDPLSVPLRARVVESHSVSAVDVAALAVVPSNAALDNDTPTNGTPLNAPLTHITIESVPNSVKQEMTVSVTCHGKTTSVPLLLKSAETKWKLLVSVSVITKGSLGIEIL